MQAKPHEVSGDKANTPGQRERSEAAYVAEFNRRFGAHKTPQDIASLRQGDHYGIGRGYTNGWWKGWQAAEAQQAPQWSHSKPAAPGAYWVRGFRIGEPDCRPALVEVTRNEEGELLCNVNESNTNDETHQWSRVEDMADRFEWFGPLFANQPAAPQTAWIPIIERTPQCRHECTSTHQMVSDTVLVTDSSNPQSLGLAHLQADGEWNVYDGEYDFMNPQSVTHWMPRPADPAKQNPVDPLYREAVAAVVHSQRASVAFLQRFLGVDYNRAARIIEAMERDRIVSGMNSDGARAVLMLEVNHA